MIRLALTLCCLIWAGAAGAQGIRVQSGDHDGFTRLVAAIGPDRDWQITRDGRDLHIAFSPAVPGFDLSGVYTLITRDRVAGLQVEDGLMLELGCDCTVEISRFQGRYAVIDITDTPYQPPAEPEPPVDLPVPDTAHDPPPALTPLAEPVAEPDPLAPTFDMEEAAAIMAEQLARAAAAGLLDAAPAEPLSAADPVSRPQPRPQVAESEPESATPQGAGQEDRPETPDPHPEPAPQATPPIVAATAYDLNTGLWPDRLIASAPVDCLAAPARPIADWRGELSFLNALGRVRAFLYDDRGSLQDDAALELAELYLVHGFGAEALFWLNERGAAPGFQRALAQYLEHGAAEQFGSFAEHELCPEALTLWLFLTDTDTPRPDAETRLEILARYFELPTPLRDIVGPDLARAFLAADDEGAALEIREALVRGGRVSAQDMAFLDAALPGSPAPPAAALIPANAGSTRADPALTLRLMSQIETQGAARSTDLVAADALIRETAPTLSEEGLRHAAALGHALAGNIDAALSHLALNGQRDAEAIRPVFADILTALMDLDRTAPLLLLLTSEEFGQFGYFPNPAFRRRVARYLLDHGLPEMARDLILAGGSDHARDRELLSLAYDRLAQDHPGAVPADPADPVAVAPIAPADTPEAVVALLRESRALRQEALALLETNPRGPTD
ncbi:hypothetical protein [Nioella sediminis]|jgi:hypothetical protein|uniref:hypothetical protein n=1 Tax=Nioella sediminis TaxID=1912092 RepID=UPI0008FD73FB|nr:hypothetical protein [Nioella sediminis]TBX28475.1 hypothetical protein TK43_06135 [Roseovarius sp. JS7-11]